MIERKQKYTLKKSKKYKNLVSVGLGIVTAVALGVAVDSEAHASDKTENPATNSITAQPELTKEQSSNLAKTNEKVGNIEVSTNKENLEKAISEAKKQGVELKEKEVKDLGVATSVTEAEKKKAEAEQDYKKQAEALEKTTEKYKEEKQKNKEETTKVVEYNKVEKERSEKETVEYNKKVEEVNRNNAQKEQDYKTKLIEYNNKVAEIKELNKLDDDNYKTAYEQYLVKKKEAKNNTEENEKALAWYKAEVNRINKENEDATKEHEKLVADKNKTNSQIEKENEEIKKRNAKKQEAYNQAMQVYNAEKEKFNKEVEDLKKNKTLLTEKNGISIYGDYNLAGAGSTAYYKDIVVVNNVEITNAESLKTSLGWNRDKTRVEKISGNMSVGTWDGYPEWYLFKNPETGDKFRITNVGTTVSGKNVNIEATVKVGNANGRTVNGKPVSEQRFNVTWGGDNSSIYFDYGNMEDFSLTMKFVDDNGNPINLAIGTVIGDVDYGQGSKLEFMSSSIMLNPPGSELKNKNGIMWSNPNSGNYNNFESTPQGTYLVAGYGDTVVYTHYNSEFPQTEEARSETDREIAENVSKGKGYGPAFNLFGKSGELKQIKTITPPKKPTLEQEKPAETVDVPELVLKPLPEKPTPKPTDEPTPPVKPEPRPEPKAPEKETLEVLPPKPIEPKYKEIPQAPKTPVFEYNYNKLQVTPNVEKQVKNLSGENIDTKLVAKLSTVKWELKTEKLNSGRELTEEIVFTDLLPNGFVLDKEASVKANKQYFDLDFKEKENFVTLTGNKELRELLNKDLNKTVEVTIPVLIGTVVNDGAIYKNNFTLEITTKKENTGNVVVHYVDKQGNTISKDVVDTKDGKEQVEFFVTDMWNSYIQLAKKHFPNAKIILDRYHIVRLATETLNKIRIEIMNKYNKDSKEYRMLYRYRELIKKKMKDVSINYKKYPVYTNCESEYQIIQFDETTVSSSQ